MLFAKSSSGLAILLVLGACSGTQAIVAPDLPPVPPALGTCFDRTVALPGADDWTQEMVVQVIAQLRESELAKTRCGQQLLGFYSDLRKELAH